MWVLTWPSSWSNELPWTRLFTVGASPWPAQPVASATPGSCKLSSRFIVSAKVPRPRLIVAIACDSESCR
jgi:hypothetical protein